MINAKAAPSVEQENQATWRRLDWRFLLPAAPSGRFRHLLLSGGPTGLASRVVEAKIADQVSCQLSDMDSADAVVLLHDSPIALEAAARILETDGVLYQEISRSPLQPFRATPQQLRKQFARAGLKITQFYWAAPNFVHCRRYVPLDASGALEWYFSALFVAGTPLHRALRAIYRSFVGGESERMGRFAPCISVTAVPAPATARPPSLLALPTIQTMFRHGDVSPLLLTSGQDDASRLIMLPFDQRQSASPEAVIKIATNPSFNEETEIEQRVLGEVRTLLEPSLRQSVPEPMGAYSYQGSAIAVESCALGHSLWASSGEWGISPHSKIDDMEVATKWIQEFHKQSESKRTKWDCHAVARWVDEPLVTYQRSKAELLDELTPAEEQLMSLAHTYAENLIGSELPLVWQHNDFAPWNIFRNGERLTVIDWEFNRDWNDTRAGPPLCDLLYFLTYWNNIVHNLQTDAAEVEGMQKLFFTLAADSKYIQASRQAIERYMSVLRIDGRFLPLLLLYTWTERFAYSHRRLKKLQPHAAKSRAAFKSANYVGVIAQHAGTIFAVEGKHFWQRFTENRTLNIVEPETAGKSQ